MIACYHLVYIYQNYFQVENQKTAPKNRCSYKYGQGTAFYDQAKEKEISRPK
jgi:hypothetical protein